MTQKRSQKRPVHGVLLFDKDVGPSSNQALQKARWQFHAEKAGHTGTLDPFATGLLPLCFGEATKFAQALLDADKRYLATLQFGHASTTLDCEGELTASGMPIPTLADIQRCLPQFTGDIEQTPPMYSALKHQGKALYEYARNGIEIAREARQVQIRQIDIIRYTAPELVLDVQCSKGTYIRTLADDIGQALGCGAYLSALRRTATAGFRVEDAITLAALESIPPAERDALLLPVDSLLLDLPRLDFSDADSAKLRHGMAVRTAENHGIIGDCRLYGHASDGNPIFLGLATVAADGGVQPKRMLATGDYCS